MTTSLATPPRFRFSGQDGAHVALESDLGFTAHLFVLEQDIFRVAVLKASQFSLPSTWSIAPGEEDVPESGRDRFDTRGFSQPDFLLTQNEDLLTARTEKLELTIALSGLLCSWRMATARGWRTIANDRPTQAYNFGWWDSKIYHYLSRTEGERYFGLGERAGNMDRSLRRFRLSNTDAMGYDGELSDPLYKHIPFYITFDVASSTAFGIFYDTYADCAFDFGAEISNYHGPFRSFVADTGDLDYYVIAGPTIADVVRRFTWLTGRPMVSPKWSLGYSGSTMSYTDAPDAQARMMEFVEKCREHDILCDSFHLSSGYSSIGRTRHVFHWNREKFPDPAAFARSYRDAGIRLLANIKPCILTENPLFPEVRAKRLAVCDDAGEPLLSQFWGSLGAYLDFTNAATRAWWRNHVTSSLLEVGIEGTWNDNNEFEIHAANAVADGGGRPLPATSCKPLQTLLMMKSSRAAQASFSPDKRPFLVSRSGPAGMQRYAQTWSGDNFTSWKTLKYNLRMGMGLALSGVSNCGHDIGGFAGPAPDPELFVRWVEAGIFMPRFSIHSWNSDSTVNEPWMHPECTGIVRDLIALRYALLPYFYDLMWRYYTCFEPVWRPLFYEFPDDPLCYEETDSYMLGAELLIAPVYEPGVGERAVYLPSGCDWADYWSGTMHGGGQRIRASAPLGRPALFAREGAAVAMNVAEQHFDRRADVRAFAVFPPRQGQIAASCYDDDGETEDWRRGEWGSWKIDIDCSDRLHLSCSRSGQRPPKSDTLQVLFRPHESRPVSAETGTILSDTTESEWRRVIVGLQA